MEQCQYFISSPERDARGAKNILGMMSCFDTTLQKLPPHLSLRMALERDSLPSNGEP